MKPLVAIIMGSTSDLPVMEKAAKFFDEMEIPFEINALSAHRTPQEVEAFAKKCKRKRYKSNHCCCRYGCTSSGCNSFNDYIACDWCSYQFVVGWDGCIVGNSANASRNSSGYSWDKWFVECGYFGFADFIDRQC